MSNAPVRFYFDYISPFAYLASLRVRALVAQVGRDVEPVPVLFAGLLNHFGHAGPAEVEPKRRWAFKQALRRAKRAGVTLEAPPHHPFNPLLALRVTHAAPANQRWSVIDALFAATWQHGRGVEQPNQVRDALGDIAVDVDELLTAAATPAIKAALTAATQEAAQAGVFGVPSFIVDRELYWGDDNLDDLLADQQQGGPNWDERVTRWSTITATAKRTAAPR